METMVVPNTSWTIINTYSNIQPTKDPQGQASLT